MDRLCTIALPDGYPSNPRNKLYLSIKQYLYYDINWTYNFVMMAAFVQLLFDFLFRFCQLEFWGGPHPEFRHSVYLHSHEFSRKTSVEGQLCLVSL